MPLVLIGALLMLQAVISVRTELVAIPVTVTDMRGRHVGGLAQADFRVYEDGRLRDITVFHHGDVPITLGVLVDRSQSMRPKGAALATAVSALLESSRPEDELFGVDFGDDVSLALAADQKFTNDATELADALSAVGAGGRTALYDAVAEGLRHTELGYANKDALVVVSDGGDNASRQTYAEVLTLARRSQAVIFAIGLLGTPPVTEDEDARLLTRLCKDTGGVAYFPKSIAEVADVARQIARDIREQYTLGFEPESRGAGPQFRAIKVTATAAGRGRLRVRTRSGYLSGAESGTKP